MNEWPEWILILKYKYVAELKCYRNTKCINGGTCEEDFAHKDYTCACVPNYIGNHCETGEKSGNFSAAYQTVCLSAIPRCCVKCVKYTVSGKNAPKHVKITLWIDNDSHLSRSRRFPFDAVFDPDLQWTTIDTGTVLNKLGLAVWNKILNERMTRMNTTNTEI